MIHVSAAMTISSKNRIVYAVGNVNPRLADSGARNLRPRWRWHVLPRGCECAGGGYAIICWLLDICHRVARPLSPIRGAS